MIKKALLFSIIIFLVFCPAGCNTFRGVGQDVQELGQGIEDLSAAEVYWVDN
ncbi:MAG: entericidin A/B family lipoprotein [Planctomycetota bacterium]|jgi:predicted small secreted protein